MNPIKLTTELNYKDVVEAYSLGNSRQVGERSRTKLSFALIVIKNIFLVILGICLTLSLIYSHGAIPKIFFTVILTIVVLVIIGSIQQRFRIKKIWRQNKVWHSPIDYIFSDDGIKINSVFSKEESTWELINKVKEDENLLLLIHPNSGYFVIPKRVFDNPSQTSEFKKMLKAKVQGPLMFLEETAPRIKRDIFK